MEPNKTYPLHPDQDDQTSTPSTPLVNSSDNTTSTSPSEFTQVQNAPTVEPTPVPWYLRPLTKTAQSPTAQDQRVQSTPPKSTNLVADKERSSPFRSQSLPPLRSPDSNAGQEKSVYRQPSEKQWQIEQQPPQVTQQLRPFSQFGTTPKAQSVGEAPVGKPKKWRRILGIAIALLLVGVIGVGTYSAWQRSRSDNPPSTTQGRAAATAEERLHRAIENHLQTRYVRQTYEQVVDGVNDDVIKLEVTSDFSDPANPKSYIRYDVQSGKDDNAIQGSGEIVVLGKNEYFGKLSKPALFYNGAEVDRPKENQWYRIAATDTIGQMLIDPMDVRNGLNSPIGEVPIGNFRDQVRQDLMRFITDRKVYTIKESNEVTESNKKLTHYTVDVDTVLVNELNNKIADAIGVKDTATIVSLTEDDIKDMELWVDDSTQKITRIKFHREYATGESRATSAKEVITTSLSYPSDGSAIKQPDAVIASPWVTR